MEKYERLEFIGSGGFGVAELVRNKETGEHFVMKCIKRGRKIDENVGREIMNHKLFLHPNIIRFKEVVLTSTHLAIVMEYAAGGDLFDRISNEGRFSEDRARYFFQQLISGVSYLHSMQICHRDLKPGNIVLVDSRAPQGRPRLKICDFGYSKSSLLHSRPISAVGTPTHFAPEVLSGREYDGKMADVWSCGATLYDMLVGVHHQLRDPGSPQYFLESIEGRTDFPIPDDVHISQYCQDLLFSMLVREPSCRITIKEIKTHPWFLEKLPRTLREAGQARYCGIGNPGDGLQSDEEIRKIVEEAAKVPPLASRTVSGFGSGGEEEDEDGDSKEEDVEEHEED